MTELVLIAPPDLLPSTTSQSVPDDSSLSAQTGPIDDRTPGCLSPTDPTRDNDTINTHKLIQLHTSGQFQIMKYKFNILILKLCQIPGQKKMFTMEILY